MTNEELRHKYRLQRLAAEQGVRTYHALDGTGHMCMVHFLPADSPETPRLVALLDRLNPGDQQRIIERVQVDGAPVLVTQLIAGFETLATWLETRAQGPPAVPAPPASPRGAGELTQMFGPASSVKPPAARDEPRAAEPSRAPPPSAAPGPAGLTQVFGPPSGAERRPPPAEPQGTPAAGPGRSAGEFTQLFGPGDAAPGPPVPPSADAAATLPSLPVNPPGKPPQEQKPSVRWRDEPANRTSDRPVVRWKKDVTPDEPRAAPAPPPPARPLSPSLPPAPERPRSKPPGELTRMFGAAGSGSGPDDAQAPPSSPPPAAANPWDLARGAGPLASPPGAGPVSPTPGPGTAPGEFTRMFEPQRNLGMPPASSPGHGSPDFFARSNPPPAPHPAAPPVPSAPPAAQPPGEFTRLMQGVVPAPAPGGVPAAPGDFTRMLAATPLPTPAAPPSAGSAEQAVQRRPRLLVLVIALAFVGITALVLVLYIALK